MQKLLPPNPGRPLFTLRHTQCAIRLVSACLVHCALYILLAACAVPPTTTASGPDPTAFLATRVAELLTQNALTDAALQVNAATPELPTTLTPMAATLALPADAAGATITALPQPMVSATPATPCADQACVSGAEHFWLERPAPAGYVNYPARTYAYGSTLQGLREPHHGVEFENPSGTPVIAAAPGTVIVAGDDTTTAYGPATNFYGRLVVVQLEQTEEGQPVLNLYAHMQSVNATVGQHVKAGDFLGTVGQTGVAIGPHLHFEVRIGRNDYLSTRNPELWLKPLLYNNRPWGVIAGRVVDTQGNLVASYPVVIRPIAIDYDDVRSKYLTTYADETLNGDDALQENFAIGDMPAGTYTVSVSTTTLYRQTVTVTSGHISWVTFVVSPPPPTETPTP